MFKVTSIIMFLIVFLELILPSAFQYVLNASIAVFGLSYILKTINRMDKKEWTNHAISKHERSRVLYVGAALLACFAFLQFAWLVSTQLDTHGHIEVSVMLDKIYSLCEGMVLIFAIYVTFQLNLELTDGKEGEHEGYITKLLKGRHYDKKEDH
jgi:L-asparagine transporter-like permease